MPDGVNHTSWCEYEAYRQQWTLSDIRNNITNVNRTTYNEWWDMVWILQILWIIPYSVNHTKHSDSCEMCDTKSKEPHPRSSESHRHCEQVYCKCSESWHALKIVSAIVNDTTPWIILDVNQYRMQWIISKLIIYTWHRESYLIFKSGTLMKIRRVTAKSAEPLNLNCESSELMWVILETVNLTNVNHTRYFASFHVNHTIHWITSDELKHQPKDIMIIWIDNMNHTIQWIIICIWII